MSVERHVMPNGDCVFYRDKDHAYFESYNELEGKGSGRVKGISTAAKRGDGTNVDGLLDWACRQEDWREEQKRKGEIGTAAHAVFEELANAVDPKITDAHGHAVWKWWFEATPLTEITECVVYSKRHNIAGRFDWLGTLYGRRTIIDLKTGSLHPRAAVQLNLYALAMKEAGFEPVEALGVLKTYDDGSAHLVDVPICERWATDALAMEESSREVSKLIRAAQKLRPAA